MACAWGGFAGYGICMLLSYLVGQRKAPIPYEVGKILFYMAFAVALYLLSKIYQPASMAARLAYNTIYLVVFVVVAYNLDIKKVLNIANIIKQIKGKILKH